MNRRQCAQISIIADHHVPRQCCLYAESNLISKLTVMSHMTACHQAAMRPHSRHHVASHRSGIDGDTFLNRGVFPDAETGVVPTKFQILWHVTH